MSSFAQVRLINIGIANYGSNGNTITLNWGDGSPDEVKTDIARTTGTIFS